MRRKDVVCTYPYTSPVGHVDYIKWFKTILSLLSVEILQEMLNPCSRNIQILKYPATGAIWQIAF